LPIDALGLVEQRGGQMIAMMMQATIIAPARNTNPTFPTASQRDFSGKRSCSLFSLND